MQIKAIDALITSSIKHDLNAHDTAYVLAIAHVESGFNQFAAAGTTASGIGQFVDKTAKGYQITPLNMWELDIQAEALVHHFKDNQTLANRRGLPEAYIYKFHHDGPKKNYGGLDISYKSVMPKIGAFTNAIRKIY